MADKRHSVTIDSIACKGSGGDGSNAEVFILWQADGGMPVRHPAKGYQRMSTSDDPKNQVVQTWKPDLDLAFDHEVLVTLWDQDSRVGYNDPSFLINVEYRADHFDASYDMRNDGGAHYVVAATKNS